MSSPPDHLSAHPGRTILGTWTVGTPQNKEDSLEMFPDLTPGGSWADSTVRKELGAEVKPSLSRYPNGVWRTCQRCQRGSATLESETLQLGLREEGKTMKYKFKSMFNTSK